MAESVKCLGLKDKYDECFISWYQVNYAKERHMAKDSLAVCNQLMIAYKNCVKDVIMDQKTKTDDSGLEFKVLIEEHSK